MTSVAKASLRLRAAVCDAAPELPPLLTDEQKHAYGVMPQWPFRRLPAGAPAACWLCGRPAAFATYDDADAHVMMWCAKHARDF